MKSRKKRLSIEGLRTVGSGQLTVKNKQLTITESNRKKKFSRRAIERREIKTEFRFKRLKNKKAVKSKLK